MSDLSNLTDQELINYHRIYQNGVQASNRAEMVKIHGYDLKFAYHLLRLLDEAQQLIETGEMDLQRAREAMKSIRRGEWKMEDLINWATAKEKELDLAFSNCTLPPKANEQKLKEILLSCLEEHYGNLSNVFQQPDWSVSALREIDDKLNLIRSKLYS